MSKNAWLFRPSDVRRGIRAVESAGLTASAVKIADGWFEILIGGPKTAESAVHPEEPPPPIANDWDTL